VETEADSRDGGRPGARVRADMGADREPPPGRAQRGWISGGGGGVATRGRPGRVYSSLIYNNIKPTVVINLIFDGYLFFTMAIFSCRKIFNF
jgi:hypothetical protein